MPLCNCIYDFDNIGNGNYQPLDADLTDLADGSLTGSKVDFSTISSSAITIGDSSQSTITLTFGLSGATDPSITAADSSLTLGNAHLLFSADNTFDIGANAATRPRNIYPAGHIYMTTGGDIYAGTWIGFGGAGGPNGWIKGQANGVIGLYDNAATSFNRIQLGGTTGSFPALKRSSAKLQARLADDSAFAGFDASTLTLTPAAANTTALTISGGSNTGSDATPQLDLSGTWNTSGSPTFLKLNVTNTASGASALLADFQVGGASKAKIDKNGRITFDDSLGTIGPGNASGGVWLGRSDVGNQLFVGYQSAHLVTLPSEGVLGWSSTTYTGDFSASDTKLSRESAAVLQMGSDAATATAQKLKAHDGSGTDKAGANLTLAGGQGTGTGRGGAFIIQTAPSSTTGSSANTYSERAHYVAKAVTLTESTATTVATLSVPSEKYLGASMTITVFASDGTDHQCRTLRVGISAVNKAGTVTAALDTPTESVAVSTGTLTATITTVANGNTVDVKVNADSSLTQTTLEAIIAITAINSNDVATVTEI